MIFKFYDRPVQNFPKSIPEYHPSEWIAQHKGDGWLTHIFRDKSRTIANPAWGRGHDGSLFFLSRREATNGGPTNIPVNEEIVKTLDELQLPDQTEIPAEWLARRTIGECDEMLLFFDLMYLADTWIGNYGFEERLKMLQKLITNGNDHTRIIPHAEGNFEQFYKELPPYTEGIILKRRTGALKGGSKKGQDTGLMVKVKYRSGASGRDVYKEI